MSSSKKSLLNLNKVKIKVNDLLLDPNNPRFSKHRNELLPDDKINDPSIQNETLKKMIESFDVDELEKSIRAKGFVPVDNVFVKKVGDKYIVIEGNRRVSAVKNLLEKHKAGKRKADVLPTEIYKTLQAIDCYDLTKNDPDEIDFILGLRHHGSIKQWGLLPSSFNIFKRYIEEDDLNEDNFEYRAPLARKIADLYSLKQSDVRDKLRTYHTYLQLRDLTSAPDLEDHFSIIGDAIKNTTLRKEFGFNETTCTFSEEGAERFLNLIYGDESHKPVIVGAAAGEGNLRDLAFVIEHGNREEDLIQRIYERREDPATVKADLKSKATERDLLGYLKAAKGELKKIRLGEIGKLGEAQKEELAEIEGLIERLKQLAD